MHHSPNPRRSATTLAAAVLLALACSRTIEEDEPLELVESRIEPCRDRCTVMLDPECGARPEDIEFDTVDECVESCAALESGWMWARQPDGTDACAGEWIALATCLVELSCEDQRWFWRRNLVNGEDYPCKAEEQAQAHCFYSTPSLDRTEPPGP